MHAAPCTSMMWFSSYITAASCPNPKIPESHFVAPCLKVSSHPSQSHASTALACCLQIWDITKSKVSHTLEGHRLG